MAEDSKTSDPKAATPSNGTGNGTGAPDAQAAASPTMQMLGQYIADLSFENPGAPGSVVGGTGTPQFNVNINVQVKKQADDVYAVELTLLAKAMREDKILFNIELVYGGVFRVAGFGEQQLAPVLMIECPRLIFPFARQVLANTTQAGGFPPLLMEPVDFASLYRQNLARMAESQHEQGDKPTN